MIGKAINKAPHKFRLRTTLVVPFVLEILAAVGIVGYLSFKSGEKAVNDIATQVRSELTTRIEQHIRNYLDKPYIISQVIDSGIHSQEINLENFPGLRSYFWHLVQKSELESYIYFGNPQGDFMGVERMENGQLTLKIRDESTAPRRNVYLLDSQGKEVELLKSTEYDPRSRPWYKIAVQTGNFTWSSIYPFASRNYSVLGITPTTPIYNSNGKLLGVLGIDISLAQISEFLQGLTISPSGQSFIMERSGELIASSTIKQPFIKKEKEPKIERLKALDSGEPLVSATTKFLLQHFGSLNAINKNQQLNFKLDNQNQFVQVTPLNDGRGIDWLIIVVVPESDFMGQINTNTRNTILLCLGALGLAIALGILTSLWVTGPVLQISQAANKLAEGNLERRAVPSVITEIDNLADSFNGMAGQLKESFDALRQSEATNRAIVTTIPDLMIRVKGDGTYVEIVGSDRLKGIHGVKRFSTGSTVRESLPPDLADLRMHHIQQALTTGQLQIYEQRITINGQTQDEEVRILVLGEDEVLIMVRDISDRKQAEEALRIAEENYRSIFENAVEGIFQSLPEGRYINANSALAKIYGYDSPSEMMEQIVDIGEQVYVDPEKRDEFKELLEKQNTIKDFEYRCYCKDSSIIWTQIDARAVRDSSGKLLYYEGIVQDITERKRREDELRRQLEELKIEIDQKKREKEVARLTESSYFQEVQQEIAEVNLDEFWS